MKALYPFFCKSIFIVPVVLIFLGISSITPAQNVSFRSNSPQGETIISEGTVIIPFNGGYPETGYVATAKEISSVKSNDGLLTFYGFAWAPPEPRFIKKVATKAGGKYVLVLLDNGDVFRLTPHHVDLNGWSDLYLGRVVSGGTQSWDDIKGDAIYTLSTSALYVTRDTGITWQIDTTGLNGAHIWSFALDTAQYVYAATEKELFKQNPNDNNWSKVTSLTAVTNIFRVFIDRINRILVAGNGGGVYLSKNNGASWSADTSGIGFQNITLFADDAFGNLYAVTGTGKIFYSKSGTKPWKQIDAGIAAMTVPRLSLIHSAVILHWLLELLLVCLQAPIRAPRG